jgi:sarcosine oxidase delta subunit
MTAEDYVLQMLRRFSPGGSQRLYTRFVGANISHETEIPDVSDRDWVVLVYVREQPRGI